MIQLFNETTKQYHKFVTTEFPDKTSQVWMIDPKPTYADRMCVVWNFESEGELAKVLQLAALIDTFNDTKLIVPFLPYGRQDKDVTNDSTFALWPIYKVLKTMFDEIITYDAHNPLTGFGLYRSYSPEAHFLDVFDSIRDDLIVFPDKGAFARYEHIFPVAAHSVVGDKVRDQATGKITGLTLNGHTGLIAERRCIIFDDICDGGMTFIKMAEKLKEHGAKRIELCVSHGIFSRGTGVLFNAGIEKIHTTNSIIRPYDENETYLEVTEFEEEWWHT